MAEFKLKMRGTTYFGKAAGVGGDEYDCSDIPDGKLSEEIRYYDTRKASSGLWSLFGKRGNEIKIGYISKGSYSMLDELGIVNFKPQDGPKMKSKSHAMYALYRSN